jgi:hypothetical protein
MALTWETGIPMALKALELGSSFFAPDRESEDLRAMREAEQRRQGYIQKMQAPPKEDVARREGEIRHEQIGRVNELMKQLRRQGRRGNKATVDRERMDDISKFVKTPGQSGANGVRNMYAKMAGFSPNANLPTMGQAVQQGNRADFLNRATAGGNLLTDLFKQSAGFGDKGRAKSEEDEFVNYFKGYTPDTGYYKS